LYKSVVAMSAPVDSKGFVGNYAHLPNHAVAFGGYRRAHGKELALVTIPLTLPSAE
jgi:hypothetical protein